MEDRIENIKKYVKIFNKEIEDNEYLELELNTLIDKVLIYIKEDKLPQELERILAKVYIDFKEQEKELKASTNGEISSISDNGQSVSFKSKSEMINSFLSSNSFITNLKEILDSYLKKRAKIYVVGEEYFENSK